MKKGIYAEIDDLNDSDLYSDIEEESNDDEDSDLDEHNSVSVSDSSNGSDSCDSDEDFEFDDDALKRKQGASGGQAVQLKKPTESIEDLDGLDDEDLSFDSDHESVDSKHAKDKPVPLYLQLKAQMINEDRDAVVVDEVPSAAEK